MNWYAYKVLADTYDADRRAQAAAHRLARQAARHAQARKDLDAVEAVARAASPGRWRSIVARLRLRPTTTATSPSAAVTRPAPRPAVRPATTELRPSLPR
jgi:hypothetical protein